jgi:DNA-binding MarR family transcriptional regulator
VTDVHEVQAQLQCLQLRRSQLSVIRLFVLCLLGKWGRRHESRCRECDQSITRASAASRAAGGRTPLRDGYEDQRPHGAPARRAGNGLAERGPSQTDIVERTGIDRSTLADIVRRLKGKGLLQRRRTKEDARAYAVRLTEEGQQVLPSAEPRARRVDEQILDALPAKRRAEFIDALASIMNTMERTEAAGV